MNILYISGMCSEEKYNHYVKLGLIKELPQAQKYHKLLVEGLSKNICGKLFAICSYPINRRSTKRVVFKCDEEKMDNIIYKYPFFLNVPIFRQLCIVLSSFIYSFLFLRRSSDSVAVCDILSASNAIGARLACKVLGKKCIGLVTDVPGKRSKHIVKNFPKYYQYVLQFIEKKERKDAYQYDAYLFLTEAMNEVINIHNKPYIVVEGHSDYQMLKMSNSIENKYEKTTILYSGGIYEEYGIEILIKAFLRLELYDCELHIYGDGNYKSKLEALATQNERIYYFGTVDNATVVEAQMKAHLLINPRLSHAEYTKYSFPSKMLEYMASGTPVISTRLPGIPIEYYQYIYTIDKESVEGFQKALEKALSQPKSNLHKKGHEAKSFILEEKNNFAQSIKLVNLIEDIFKQKDD